LILGIILAPSVGAASTAVPVRLAITLLVNARVAARHFRWLSRLEVRTCLRTYVRTYPGRLDDAGQAGHGFRCGLLQTYWGRVRGYLRGYFAHALPLSQTQRRLQCERVRAYVRRRACPKLRA